MNEIGVRVGVAILTFWSLVLLEFGTSTALAQVEDTVTATVANRPVAAAVLVKSLEVRRPTPTQKMHIYDIQLRVHLEVLAAAIRSKDMRRVDLAVYLIEEARDVLGAPNAILASTFLLQEAKAARNIGQLTHALHLAQQAIRLSPDLLGGHWLNIELIVLNDPARLALVLRAFWAMVGAWGRSFRNQVNLVYSVIVFFGWGAAATWVLFAVILFIRYARYQAHDLALNLPWVFGWGEMALTLALAIILPTILNLGWPASVALILGLTLAYQNRREQILSYLGLILIFLSPCLVEGFAPLVAFPGSRMDHLAIVSEEAQPGNSEEMLKAYSQKHKSDGLTQLVLGLQAARRSNTRDAMRYFEASTVARPQLAEAFNNLGVIKYRMGEVRAAKKNIKKAIEIGSSAPVYLNLSLIELSEGDLDSAHRLNYDAYNLNSEITMRFRNTEGLPIEERFVLLKAPLASLWSELFRMAPQDTSATRAELWEAVIKAKTPPWHMPAWSLFSLFLGLMGFFSKERSQACSRCGYPAVKQGKVVYCSQCHSIASSARAIAPAARQAKEREVRAYQLWSSWREQISAFLPGCFGLLRGERTLSSFCRNVCILQSYKCAPEPYKRV